MAAPDMNLLNVLAQELRTLRALPLDTPTHARCPGNREALTGLSQAQIENALGKPDQAFSPEDPKPSPRWTYVFSTPQSPRPGGGFPELTFTFGPDQRVIQVTCHYGQ